MINFARFGCLMFTLFICILSVQGNQEPCNGAIRYADWNTFLSSEEPITYCYTDFESLPGTPVVNPIEGVFIPFFISTDAALGDDDATYTGSTLTSTAGTIYDFVASGRPNNGEASKYIHFLNITSDDLNQDNITLSFVDESGNCMHELVLNLAEDLPELNINETCPIETNDCEFAFKIEFIDWASFSFQQNPTAYCAEELTLLHPEANGTFDGGRTDTDKPGVYVPFSIRSNAPATSFDNTSLSVSNGAIYRSSQPPQLNDGTASSSIYFVYLTESNLTAESITITFADSTNICVAEKQIEVASSLNEVNPSVQCISQDCGNGSCDGIEDYGNCPDDCTCNGAIQFVNWPSFDLADTPQSYCAEDLNIDSIGFSGGNTNMNDPGFYVPFIIDTEALPNDDGMFEGSSITTSVGTIFNATNPPSENDGVAANGVHFLYLTQSELAENTIDIIFNDSLGNCEHNITIQVNDELPEAVPNCPCVGEIRFIDWDEQTLIDKAKTYCAEDLGDYDNWGSNVDTPSVFIPFVIRTGATVGMDSVSYEGSSITATVGTIYNTTIPPSVSNGEARVFIHLLSVNAFDLEQETINIEFMDSTGTCLHSYRIKVDDLGDVQPEVCLEAECGNDICEAVENFDDCPEDCDCQGAIRFLELQTWPNLVSSESPNAYCVEQLVPPGTNVNSDTQNPGVFIPFTIQSQASIDSNNVYLNSKINTNVGSIYNVEIPPVINEGDAENVHYLFIAMSDLESGGNVIELTFSSGDSACVHLAEINLVEDLPDLDPMMQCIDFVCGDEICDAAESYGECPEDCPCLGAIEFVDWETLTTTSAPRSYCYESIGEGMNPIDTIDNRGVFIPFRVKTNATLNEDSIYTNSTLSTTTGTLYDNIEIPVKNEGEASIYVHFLHLSYDEWEIDSTQISFKDESGNCTHDIILNFSEDINEGSAPPDCEMVGVNELLFKDDWMPVYPNPATTQLYIDVNDSQFKVEGIHLYNTQGQLIDELDKTEFQTNTTLAIKVAYLNSGTYFVALYNNKKGIVGAQRFVKTKL